MEKNVKCKMSPFSRRLSGDGVEPRSEPRKMDRKTCFLPLSFGSLSANWLPPLVVHTSGSRYFYFPISQEQTPTHTHPPTELGDCSLGMCREKIFWPRLRSLRSPSKGIFLSATAARNKDGKEEEALTKQNPS